MQLKKLKMNKTRPNANNEYSESGRGEYGNISNDYNTMEARPSVLVHSCCGPCSTAVVERLIVDNDVTLFFYNPNITEEDEYKKRLEAQEIFVEKYNSGNKTKGNLSLVKTPYDPDYFFKNVIGLEQVPEGGERCAVCFRIRMEKAAEYASLHGYEKFTTTLSVSPHKNYNIILKLGGTFALKYGLSFVADNFKKMAGFQRSIELSKAYDLYRQSYCGCIFSKNEQEGFR